MGCTTAVVNGKHSNQCYLDAMQGAFDSFAAKAKRLGTITPGAGECITDYIDHLLFHIPYPKMVEYASSAIFRHDWGQSRRCREIEEEIGRKPNAREYEDLGKYQAAEADYARRFRGSKDFLEAFGAKVRNTVTLSRQVGNIYTGSIYLGLASLLETQKIHAGERLCLRSHWQRMFGPRIFSNSAAAGQLCALERSIKEATGEKADIAAGL